MKKFKDTIGAWYFNENSKYWHFYGDNNSEICLKNGEEIKIELKNGIIINDTFITVDNFDYLSLQDNGMVKLKRIISIEKF